MRAGMKAFRLALAAHDVGFGAHRTWNDAELSTAGTHRALARNPHRLAKMPLARDVVVMTVDGAALGAEGRQLPAHDAEDGRHHDFTVVARKLLCPGDAGDVILKQGLAFLQPGEIAVRQWPRQLAPIQRFA